jgi:ferritin-like metal-binding protein YciE
MSQTPTGTEQLVAWLDDAYAMETGLIPILQNQASHFGECIPAAARRLQQHVVETQQHAQRFRNVSVCSMPRHLESSRPSPRSSDPVEGATTAIFRDQLVKDALADYAWAQFEVACYTALVSAATELEYDDVARLCKQTLQTTRRWRRGCSKTSLGGFAGCHQSSHGPTALLSTSLSWAIPYLLMQHTWAVNQT